MKKFFVHKKWCATQLYSRRFTMYLPNVSWVIWGWNNKLLTYKGGWLYLHRIHFIASINQSEYRDNTNRYLYPRNDKPPLVLGDWILKAPKQALMSSNFLTRIMRPGRRTAKSKIKSINFQIKKWWNYVFYGGCLILTFVGLRDILLNGKNI